MFGHVLFGNFQRTAASRAISFALILGAAAQAENFFWNPSTALLNSGADVNKTANWSQINDGGGAWPKSSFDDDFTSNTLNGAWKFQDKDNDASTGGFSLTTNVDQLTLSARGKDIWTVDNEYVAAWRSDITGDFDVSVKITSLTNSNVWAKTGILIANDSANFGAGGCFSVFATPERGIVIQFDSMGVIGEQDYPGVNGPDPLVTVFPVWVRAAKKNGVFYGYFKRTLNAPWTFIRTAVPQVKATNSHIGLFLTSHNVATTATVVFDDFQASGPVPANTMDLSFNGTSTTADSNAILTAPLSVPSVDMTNYTGRFSFETSTLTVTAAKADFSTTATLDAGTGALAFTAATGIQVFSPRQGVVLPITKSGAGTLQIAARPLVAGALSFSGGVLDLGGFTNQFAGINATAGAFTGMDANDTLIVTGDANFSGLTGFPAAGSVQIRSQGTPSAAQILIFTPGTISFNHLYLWAIGSAQPARIVTTAGTLQVKGNLILRDESLPAGVRGVLDFSTHNPSVTVDGNIYRVDNGSGGAPSQQLLMGAGAWTTKGNVSLSFQNAGSADNSTLDLAAGSPAAQTLVFTGGPLANVKHSGSGTLSLGSPLSAKSMAHSAGVLNLNNNNITVTGDIAVTNGSSATLIGLGGRDVHADGNITLTGQAGNLLNLNPGGAWTISAGGTLNADFAAIARSAATAPVGGNATSNCPDQGGNTGWIFAPLTTPPTIKTEPADATVLTGVTAEFTVAAEGAPPLRYEWRKRGGDTTTIARTATLTLLKPAAADSASLYYCTVLNDFGTKVTRDAMLNVNDPAHITVQPVNVSVVEGNPAVFSLKAKGSRKLSFVWKKKSDGSTAPGDSVLTLPAVSTALNGSIWTCTVTNAFGETTSDEVTLTVNRIPSISKQPVDLVVLGGQTARFSVTASGTDPLTFQWYRKSDLVPLTADSVLTVATAAGDDSARYYCVVKNLHGEVTSYAAKLTVGVIPVIQAEPRDSSVLVGKTASFKVRVTGSAPLGFQWQKVGSSLPIPGDSVLSLGPTVFADSGARYFCVVANVYGKDTSAIVTLRVNRPASILTQPRDTAVAAGQKASFKVSAAGSGKLLFKWRKKGDTTVVSPDSVLNFAATVLADSGSLYICTVSNDYGQVLTREAMLVVVQGALIRREPIDISVGLGKKAVFSVGAVGANPMTFKWRRGSDTATISKDSVFSLDSVKLSDDGALFRVIVKNDFGADTSRQARLNVVVCDSVFQVSPESLTVDEGRPVVLKGKAACSQSRFWTVISGPAPILLDPEVDTLNLIAPRVAVDTVLVYRFTASYSAGTVYKEVVIKVRNVIPDPLFTLPAKSKWNGQTRLSIRPALTNSEALKASAYSPPFRYQWFLSIGIVDTVQAGDSLSLSNPVQDGTLEVTLCLDNGGAVQCAVSEVEIDRLAVRMAGRRNVTGPIALSGGRITWNVSGSARVWNWQGRLLWEGRGRRGESAELPPSAIRALRGRSARLEIRPD